MLVPLEQTRWRRRLFPTFSFFCNNRILKGGVVIPLIFPKVPQSSQTESLGFPSYPLPLNTLQFKAAEVETSRSVSEADSWNGLQRDEKLMTPEMGIFHMGKVQNPYDFHRDPYKGLL